MRTEVGFAAVMKTSQNRVMPRETAQHPQAALWPWIVMPLVVLIVFYILHYVVRHS